MNGASTDNRAVETPYGVIGSFHAADDLLDAVQMADAEGYTRLEAYSPFPIEGLPEALRLRRGGIAVAAMVAGVLGTASAYLLLWWMNAVDYPINVGGRPTADWTSFTLPAFEMCILFAALATLGAMLLMNGLPRLYHPVFNADIFSRASRDRFLLCITREDPQYDDEAVRAFLQKAGADAVESVPQ